MCPEYIRGLWRTLNKDSQWVDDAGNDALARCSDCAKYPGEEECCNIDQIFLTKLNKTFLVSCCTEVEVTTSNSDVAAEFIGTYVSTTSEGLVNGRVVYRKTANNREQCLWFGGDYWVIFYCNSLGGGGG